MKSVFLVCKCMMPHPPIDLVNKDAKLCEQIVNTCFRIFMNGASLCCLCRFCVVCAAGVEKRAAHDKMITYQYYNRQEEQT